jgi:exosome complex component RRP40
LGRLLDPNHFLLPFLGARFPFEAAVGVNGRVWIKAKESKQIIAIARCIEGFDPGGSGLDEEGVVRLFGSLEI